MGKRKAAPKGESDAAPKKPAVRKIPKLVSAKILMLLAESEVKVDKPTMKVILERDYDFPDNAENKNKVWKALRNFGKREDFGRVGKNYHGGENSLSYQTIDDADRAAELERKNQPRLKFTCQECGSYDYFSQIEEAVHGEKKICVFFSCVLCSFFTVSFCHVIGP